MRMLLGWTSGTVDPERQKRGRNSRVGCLRQDARRRRRESGDGELSGQDAAGGGRAIIGQALFVRARQVEIRYQI